MKIDDASLLQPSEHESIQEALLYHLNFSLAKDVFSATRHDYYLALVYAVRERLIHDWLQTQQRYYNEDRKRVYYLSMEYLTGRTLANALINLGMMDDCRNGLKEIGLDLDGLIASEWEAGLGNGGLGRLAACLLDSMATLGLPGYGYGIRYEFGIFQQQIKNGCQVEAPDNWLRFGNPWEIARPEDFYSIRFGGYVRELTDSRGRKHVEWVGDEEVMAMAYDTPIPGYRNSTVNTLRLWSAESSCGFNLDYFNRGDYISAIEQKSRSKSISRVLYPNDNVISGKELRLKQEYFFVAASLQDILRRYKKTRKTFEEFSGKVAIQLNDTHPALAIPELMRIFVDVEQLGWDEAWELTVATFGYTNHTLLPEALEEWPVDLLGRILPRHLQIIFEINHRFLGAVHREHPGDIQRLKRMSLIAEPYEPNGQKRVRMSHLAVVGSHAVNGVSQVHSDLLRARLFKDFDEFYSWRFLSTTNGITPRRWLLMANPDLVSLIKGVIGDRWITDFNALEELLSHAGDAGLGERWMEVKRANKIRLAATIEEMLGIRVDVDSLFDCQVKRIHEYKRQLLNLLHVIALYNRIREHGQRLDVPRTVILAGKAAPGYKIAKVIVRLIHAVADVVNHDPRIGGQLKVVFLPNYNVSLAEKIIPATDLSEQISTAGTEASGTGNMKCMLNGALTIGTLDGANIEIREAVGEEHFFMFGKTVTEVQELNAKGYDPWEACRRDPQLRQAVEMIQNGFFSSGDETVFQPLIDSLYQQRDRYLVFEDFADYMRCQKEVSETYRDQAIWSKKSIINTACAVRFSSDRTVQTYAREIWGVGIFENQNVAGVSGEERAEQPPPLIRTKK